MNSPTSDVANAEFWNELCGSSFARHLGISDHSIESLRRFDRAYLDLYPYLLRHVPAHEMAAKRVLEIGLGYGTLGQKIAEAGAVYTGLDIAAGPVKMMRHRLQLQGLAGTAMQGSMLECPLPSESQDCVVSIGCFHHTGNVQRCMAETLRVLRPGGHAYLMVYNRFSYRQWLRWPMVTLAALRSRTGEGPQGSEARRRAYDADTSGKAAPETVFLSIAELQAMLVLFSSVQFTKENCDHISLRGRTLIPRGMLLATVGRVGGLDIYIHAVK